LFLLGRRLPFEPEDEPVGDEASRAEAEHEAREVMKMLDSNDAGERSAHARESDCDERLTARGDEALHTDAENEHDDRHIESGNKR